MLIILKEDYPTLYLKESKSMKKKGETEAWCQNFADLFKCPHHLFSSCWLCGESWNDRKHQAHSHWKSKKWLKLGYAYLDEKVAGSWLIKDGKLYKGDTPINDHDTLVDQLAEYTDDTITIFQGNTRVATNVMLNGKRAVGTEVSPEVKALY